MKSCGTVFVVLFVFILWIDSAYIEWVQASYSIISINVYFLNCGLLATVGIGICVARQSIFHKDPKVLCEPLHYVMLAIPMAID